MLARFRDACEHLEQVASQRLVVAIRNRDRELFLDRFDLHPGVHQDIAVREVLIQPALVHVVFVADLADDFLDQVFYRHDAHAAAVLVHGHCELDFFPPHLFEEIVGRLGLGHKIWRPHQLWF